VTPEPKRRRATTAASDRPRAPSAPRRAGRRPPRAAPVAPGLLLNLPSDLTRAPVTAIVYGRQPDLTNLVTYGLVAWAGTQFSWIDVRERSRAPSAWNPVALGAIPPSRLFVVDELGEMAPDPMAPGAVRSVVRADEPVDSMEQLSAFVRLPRPVQQALARAGPTRVPAIMVVSNAHRLSPLYASANVPALLEEITSLGASLFVTFGAGPPVNRSSFDYVIRVDAPSVDRWDETTLHFERAGPSGAPVEGRRIPLRSLGPMGDLVRAAIEGSAGGRAGRPPG